MKQVLLLGDSLRMGYQPIVSKLLEGKAQVSGPEENGRWAGYTLNSLRFWIPDLPTPDVVHWNCGLWDLGDDYNLGRPFSLPEEYESAVERTVIVLQKLFPGVKIAMATTMRTASSDTTGIENYNQIIKKVAAKYNIPVNDLFEVTKDLPELVGSDHIHLTDEGYDLVAGKVAAEIEKLL